MSYRITLGLGYPRQSQCAIYVSPPLRSELAQAGDGAYLTHTYIHTYISFIHPYEPPRFSMSPISNARDLIPPYDPRRVFVVVLRVLFDFKGASIYRSAGRSTSFVCFPSFLPSFPRSLLAYFLISFLFWAESARARARFRGHTGPIDPSIQSRAVQTGPVQPVQASPVQSRPGRAVIDRPTDRPIDRSIRPVQASPARSRIRTHAYTHTHTQTHTQWLIDRSIWFLHPSACPCPLPFQQYDSEASTHPSAHPYIHTPPCPGNREILLRPSLLPPLELLLQKTRHQRACLSSSLRSLILVRRKVSISPFRVDVYK